MRSLISFSLYVAWCAAVILVIETSPPIFSRLLSLLSAVVLVVLMWRRVVLTWRSWRARRLAKAGPEQVLADGERPESIDRG